MTQHPCRSGPDGAPCQKIRPGQPYDIAVDCRLCWLFAHNPRYNAAWGGDGRTTPVTGTIAISTSDASPAPARRFQLGDTIETALTRIGVTKERVETWLGRPCGCAERKERLNRLSEWAITSTKAGAKKALSWLNRLLAAEEEK